MRSDIIAGMVHPIHRGAPVGPDSALSKAELSATLTLLIQSGMPVIRATANCRQGTSRSTLMIRGLLPAIVLSIGLLLPAGVEGADLPGFIRGDCNADGSSNISDPIFLLEVLFGAGTPSPCEDACDVSDDGALDLADAILMLGHVFTGSPAVYPAPVQCGSDPTDDGLTCELGTCAVGVLIGERSFTLETARQGLPYSGDLPVDEQQEVTWQEGFSSGVIQARVPFVEYGFPLDSTLPGDLSLDATSGLITGTSIPPGLHSFSVWARDAADEYTLIHIDLPSFGADETEFAPGQPLDSGGAYLVALLETSFLYTHPLPWPTPYPLYFCNSVQPPAATFDEVKALRIFYPLTANFRTPLLVFHHGTGYDWTSYQQLLIHLASHGITCVSVNDQYPYFPPFTDYYCWGGHDESARVMLAVRELVEEFDLDPSHPLFGRVDRNRVFYGGHSRGAGAALVARELDPDVRGVFCLQGTDVRRDATVGNTNRWIQLPDVPVLSITAEQDTDVIYPFSERILERFTGPATMVTIYGGCHAYSTDAATTGCAECVWNDQPPAVDSCRYISRSLQHTWTKRFATAFFHRYGFGDLSVEGLLYGDEYEGSPFVGVTSRRNLSGVIPVADFEDFPMANRGGLITATGTLLFIKGPCYDWPFPLPAPIDPITNLVMIAAPNGVTTVTIPFLQGGVPLDVTGTKKLTFRIKNHDIHGVADNIGYGHLSLDVRLEDHGGGLAQLSADPHLPQIEFHPAPEPAVLQVPLKYQRFITVSMPLDDFLAANPLLDLGELNNLRLTITTNGTAAVDVRLGFDDFQFE